MTRHHIIRPSISSTLILGPTKLKIKLHQGGTRWRKMGLAMKSKKDAEYREIYNMYLIFTSPTPTSNFKQLFSYFHQLSAQIYMRQIVCSICAPPFFPFQLDFTGRSIEELQEGLGEPDEGEFFIGTRWLK